MKQITNHGKLLFGKELPITCSIILLVCICLLFSCSKPEKKSDKESIAIMVFQNDSKDSAYDFLSLALSDAIIAKLMDFHGLKTINREQSDFLLKKHKIQLSDFSDKDKAINAGNAMSVQYAVIGSFATDGRNIQIRTTLISTETGDAIPFNDIKGKYSDLFKLQTELFTALLQNLNIKPTENEAPSLFLFFKPLICHAAII